ncbi:DNA polymerase-4 [Fluviicoccus keumensis]|uniref:DNA polymerase IV n=1 Tax=Fluviicoccus keumensis TaxID=1435465 RepID=A0A4V2G6B5_9GAMM|nr:DNA polymerase IV [Fluviicoccus keumensis]RZU48066.1 DNA polymerase-4 [Fluviicoccus keumensis]
MSVPPSPAPLRRIAHLDMDAFFASVELLRYPQLQGLPVVIGGGRRQPDERPTASIPVAEFPRLREYVGRGVITTATYAARRFGVGSAMGMMKAAKLCPEAIMLPVDFDRYRHFSRLFKAEILKLAPVMEDRGVDEVYIDLSGLPGVQADGGLAQAKAIQAAIFTATGLTCSVGVAPNKLLAKMASEFQKPNGISLVFAEDVPTRIWPLPCRKINGIGPKTDQRLQALGIHTIAELAARDEAWLIARFGKSYGAWLHAAAHGRDDRPLVTESEPVSVSRETTFSNDLHVREDRAALAEAFTRLCERVAADLQRKGYVGRTIGIKIRYDNFRAVTRDHTVEEFTADAKTIRRLAGECLKRVPLDRRIRLLGVRVGTLAKRGGEGAPEAPAVLPGETLSLF